MYLYNQANISFSFKCSKTLKNFSLVKKIKAQNLVQLTYAYNSVGALQQRTASGKQVGSLLVNMLVDLNEIAVE